MGFQVAGIQATQITKMSLTTFMLMAVLALACLFMLASAQLGNPQFQGGPQLPPLFAGNNFLRWLMYYRIFD
nr:hypothetical protein BaRGS_003184 [Batillaria attramentaria]